MVRFRICVALLGAYLGHAFAGCGGNDDKEPGSPCEEEGSRECDGGGVQFCGIHCNEGSAGTSGSCDDSPKWSVCVEDPVCKPGDEQDCGFGPESKCVGAAADCILDLANDGVPIFDDGDCFC